MPEKVFKRLSLVPEVVRHETGRCYNHVSYYVKKRDLHCGRRQRQEHRWEQRHTMRNLEAVPVHDSWFNLLLFFGHVSDHVGS